MRWYLILIGGVILLAIYWFGRKRQSAKKYDVFGDVSESHPDVLMRGEGESLPREDAESRLEAQLRQLEASSLTGRYNNGTPPPEAPVEYVEPTFDESLPRTDPLLDEPVSRQTGPLAPSAEEIEGVEETATDSDAGEPLVEETPEAALEVEAPPEIVVMYVTALEGESFRGRAVLQAFHAHKLRFGDRDIFHRLITHEAERHTIFSVANMLTPGTLIPGELVYQDVKGLTFFMQVEDSVDAAGCYNEMLNCAQHMASSLGGELKDNELRLMNDDRIARIREQLRHAGV